MAVDAAPRDAVACGELLIDFVAAERGVTLAEASSFVKAAGGAPANVVVGMARLGRSVGFMGQVGDDEFGHFLAATLRASGVDTAALRFSDEARTALAFVSLLPDGERDFMFYRHPSADMRWTFADGDEHYAAATRVFHFGSISLIDEPSRGTTLRAATVAREAGAIISYDPNLRLPLWPSPAVAKHGILIGMNHAQIVKLSLDELRFLTTTSDPADGVRQLWRDETRLVVVTLGAAGCRWFTHAASGDIPGFRVRAVDTTGAGDGFVAGLLTGLLEADLRWDTAAITHAVQLANAAGALTTTRRGAIPALPDRKAVDQLLSGG